MTTAVFRVDSSGFIGAGHVARCLTLAEELRRRGVESGFVCREHPGNMAQHIAGRGFDVARLPLRDTAEPAPGAPAHAAWLGAPVEVDAAETRAAIAGWPGRCGWLVSDHYGVDERWERELRADADRIMAIDDLADRVHDCDLLLDENLTPAMHARYADKVPRGCLTLIGPRYALLAPAYAQLRGQTRPRRGAVKKLLIFFGGADQARLTEKSLEAFVRLGRDDIEVDVVIAATMSEDQGVLRHGSRPNIHIHRSLPTLAPLIAAADLAVGASGATSWERLCLGLPALVITLAENQRPLAEALSAAGLVIWLGHAGEVDVADIELGLRRIVDAGLEERWSRECMEAVDGEGLARVCGAMLAGPATALSARPVSAADELLLLEWANDATTRSNAFSTAAIEPGSHRRWLQGKLAAGSECAFFIIETAEGVPVGQVRFDRDADAWTIDYSVAPGMRGRGLGDPLLRTGLARLAEARPAALVRGHVKEQNAPSRRVFERLGFTPGVSSPGVVEYRRYL